MKPAEIRILAVDDDPDILNSTVRLLEKVGYTVHKTSGGKEALQAVQDHRPDMLLLDHDMPGIDGIEVCRRIMQDPALAEMLVVIVSASHAESDQQSAGLESGADGYIGRPIANRELLARVGSFARILQLTRSLRQQTEELRARNDTMARFHRVAVGCELRMIELKREENELCGKLGEPPHHRLAADETSASATTETPA